MEQPTASQLSEGSSVLDLSCTYNISSSLLQPEPIGGTWEEDSSCALTSASPTSSLNRAGYRTSQCEDNENRRLDDDESLSVLLPRSGSSIEQRSGTLTSSSKPQANEDHDDAQIRAKLDAFYELSSLPGDDEFSQKLTEKITELKQKNRLYALRSVQIAKIILQQEGTKVLQDSAADNAFSSTGNATKIKPVPGISDDVVRFLTNRKSTNEGP